MGEHWIYCINPLHSEGKFSGQVNQCLRLELIAWKIWQDGGHLGFYSTVLKYDLEPSFKWSSRDDPAQCDMSLV